MECVVSDDCVQSAYFEDCCTKDNELQRGGGPSTPRKFESNSSVPIPIYCACRDLSGPATSLSDGLLFLHLALLCVSMGMVTLACRRYFSRRRRFEPVVRRERAPNVSNDSYLSQIELSVASLVRVDTGEGVCCVCLDPLGDTDLVKPPNCDHVTHRACLTTWIDQARVEAAKRPLADAVLRRILSCPICARSLLPSDHVHLQIDDIEAQLPDDLSDDDGLSDDDDDQQDDEDHQQAQNSTG